MELVHDYDNHELLEGLTLTLSQCVHLDPCIVMKVINLQLTVLIFLQVV